MLKNYNHLQTDVLIKKLCPIFFNKIKKKLSEQIFLSKTHAINQFIYLNSLISKLFISKNCYMLIIGKYYPSMLKAIKKSNTITLSKTSSNCTMDQALINWLTRAHTIHLHIINTKKKFQRCRKQFFIPRYHLSSYSFQ
jgi:hypothetical protein